MDNLANAQELTAAENQQQAAVVNEEANNGGNANSETQAQKQIQFMQGTQKISEL